MNRTEMGQKLKAKLEVSDITYQGEELAICGVWFDEDQEGFRFNVDGKTGDYDDDYHEVEIVWDEEALVFKGFKNEDEDYESVKVKTPTDEQALAMNKALAEVEQKIQETRSAFKELGFERDMVFLHEKSDLIEWNSSRC